MPRPRASSRSWAPRRTNGSCPTSWPWSTTGSPWPRWPIPSIWSIPPSTAAAGSWVPEALRGLGVKHLHCVPEQMVLDGNFPTVVSPNPENPEASIWPSVGGQGGRRLYSGHRPGQRPGGHHGSQPRRLLHPRHRQPDRRSDAGLPHRAMRRAGKLPEHPYFLKTIVTTEMARKVAEANGVTLL